VLVAEKSVPDAKTEPVGSTENLFAELSKRTPLGQTNTANNQ
jgi:hypothetical protein